MKISVVPFQWLIGSTTILNGLLGLTIGLLSVPTQALTVKEVPNPRQISGNWVTDSAEILSPETEVQLNQMINQLESKDGSEMAVVTVLETKPSVSPKAFTTDLFNYWHIGKKEQDNGVLFLISKNDRRVEIETGYGVETVLSDEKVGNIISTEIIPHLKKNDFNGGTIAGTRSLIEELEISQNINKFDLRKWLVYSRKFDSMKWLFGIVVVCAIALVIAINKGMFRKRYFHRRSKRYSYNRYKSNSGSRSHGYSTEGFSGGSSGGEFAGGSSGGEFGGGSSGGGSDGGNW